MKVLVLVGSFNQETALVGAFSMIVETNVSIAVLVSTCQSLLAIYLPYQSYHTRALTSLVARLHVFRKIEKYKILVCGGDGTVG